MDIFGFHIELTTEIKFIGIGLLMLLGSFATINNVTATKFDHDMSLILLIVGAICIGVGAGFIDITTLKGLLPSSSSN